QKEAEDERNKADTARKDAENEKTKTKLALEQAKTELRHFELMHYHDRIAAADRAIRDNDFVTAHENLDGCRWDFRNVEYHYLARQLDQREAPVLRSDQGRVVSRASLAAGDRWH